MDVLSAIGGTMGLLTGFSIISGVEILYFVIKFSLNLVGKAGLKANTKYKFKYNVHCMYIKYTICMGCSEVTCYMLKKFN